MNRDDVIRMAREAGLNLRGHYDEPGSTPQELERFFHAAYAAGAKAEQGRLHAELERCKQVCAATAEGWRVERAALLKTMKWLDNWMGAKPMTECSEKVRAAIKAAEGEKT